MVHGEENVRFRGYGNQGIAGPNDFESDMVREFVPNGTNPKREKCTDLINIINEVTD